MRGIIDRFEADQALVEVGGKIKIIQRSQLPTDAREGMVVVFAQGKWSIDHESTLQRQQEVELFIDDLFK